jgi:single-strand DNA-binding protein
MALPRIELEGNLVADPELRFTASGKAVANFRVATSERKKQGDEWVDGDECFLDCSIWDEAAENVTESLTVGAKVIVTGRLRQRSYETNSGEKRTVYEVKCDSVGPSLRNATAKVNRAERSQSTGRITDDVWAKGDAHDEPPF